MTKDNLNITLTKKALREYVSNFIDDNLLYFLINKYNKCKCDEEEGKKDLTNPKIEPTIGKDESKPIDPVDEYEEQYLEAILRKEVREILEKKYENKS